MNRSAAFILALLVHLVLLALLIGQSQVKGCKKEPEQVVRVNLQDLPLPEPTEPPAPTEPEPTRKAGLATRKPTPTATPTPKVTRTPTPTPKPTATKERATPKPTKKPTPRLSTADKIKTRIALTPRPTRRLPTPATSQVLSEAQVRATMQAGFSGTTGGAASSTEPVSFSSVESAIYSRFYSAWQQPSYNAPPVKVQIELARNGEVLSTRILRPSGDAGMDDSVRAALSAVSFVKELPANFDKSSKVFEMKFEITE